MECGYRDRLPTAFWLPAAGSIGCFTTMPAGSALPTQDAARPDTAMSGGPAATSCGVRAAVAPWQCAMEAKKRPGDCRAFPFPAGSGGSAFGRRERQGATGRDRRIDRLELPAAHRVDRLAVEDARRVGADHAGVGDV